ncbi:MAG: lysine--tRNA ligase [Planctomycetota bacterium]|nr:MAG: lysine--tRNA ligase [Planctomycetota bacterium]
MALEYPEDRLQKLAALREAGVDPYPATPPSNREYAAQILNSFEQREGQNTTVCGRVMARRGYGKLAFIDLDDCSGRIQAVMEKSLVEPADFALLKHLNLGDFIEVSGELKRTNKGQPSVYGTKLRILSKAMTEPPAKWHGLNDVELRARMRYVDLFANEGVRETFLKRSAILSSMRQTLVGHNFIEVETPVLHPIYGGANARPFTTHHNALDMNLYLRIAPELYLKRLLVGGIERVFELARVFRNEGLSNRHNPEFTMLEFYQAYSDYHGMLALTEEIVVNAARAAGLEGEDGSITTTFRKEVFNLTPPFARVRYAEAFTEHVGIDPCDGGAVEQRLLKEEIKVTGEGDYFWWKAVNNLFERFVEPHLRGPIFVTDYPAAICPLAKPSVSDPVWAERFEFFLGGMELANAFSELNDPQLQMENFERQAIDSDPEAPNAVDHDYVRALGYGMPPAGGCGIGVDRLIMVLLGCDTIRDVLLFPHMRPETEE